MMKLPHLPAAIVFDMDGLLFDTEALYQEAFTLAAFDRGYDMPSPVFLSMVGHPWPVNRVQLLDHYGPIFPVDEFGEAVRQHFGSMADTHLRLKPGVFELLDVLDELRLPRAIATASKHDTVRHHLAAHALHDRFHAVVAHGDYAASKPAPDPYLNAAERLGMDSRSCLALEDSYAGVRSASSASMTTIMVPDLLQPTDEIRRLCAHVAADLHEVRGLISDASLRRVA
jgi:beta-phosphoglucomutase-like phosphatase (HAD superfamily)